MPLLLLVELKKNSYRFWLPDRKILFRSETESLLLSLRSDRKIILLFEAVIATIFCCCFGQQVETFRELTFCIEQVRLVRIDAKETAAAAAALLGT